ncbi:uncharacterized protein LOC128720248 [Anopheles nili]|uniref:uncharacterized protein LOC128720248 n=1 Tax=Anopheles nili TaxID=185578 RepID=UPI00237B8C3D|nr:uncharacterized protein LOC128720248 [Anopheles nili]
MFGDPSRAGVHESDDEDDYFKPTNNNSGKSTLAKIFGLAPKAAISNTDRATAPKAPKPIKVSDRYGPSNFRYIPSEPTGDEMAEDTTKPSEWVIVRASVVTAYKLVDGDNLYLGKVGLAMLKSTNGHRLLLYRTKTDVLGTVTLSRETKVFVKQDYIQFRTDDSSDFWSVLFESEPDRQAMLAVVEAWCCVEREPLVEEPMSEAEKDPEPSKQTRTELAARMARMGGQAMPLPERAKAPPIPMNAPGSDSSDTSDSKIETIPARPIRRPNVVSALNMQMVPLTGMVPNSNIPSSTLGSTQQGTSVVADVNFNLIMSENRMQNTEMRMNITKLESKLDRVLDRIDLLSLQGSSDRSNCSTEKDAEVLELEEKLLELKRANHALKSKVRTLEDAERNGRRDADAKLEEKLHAIEESERRLKADIVILEKKLQLSRVEVERQKERFEMSEKQLADVRQADTQKTKDLEEALGRFDEVHRERDDLKEKLMQESRRSEEAKLQLEQLQKEVDTLKQCNQRAASSSSLVKDIMNGCYQQLCDQITDPQVLRIIAQTIKRETKAALERESN